MPCPILTTAYEQLKKQKSYVFSIDEDLCAMLDEQIIQDYPSIDTQRLRAFYVVEHMILQLTWIVNLNVGEMRRSAEWLTAVIQASEKTHRSLAVARGYRKLMPKSGDTVKAKSLRDEQSSRAIQLLEYLKDTATILRSYLAKDEDMPKRIGQLFGLFGELRDPEEAMNGINDMLNISIHNPISAK